MQKIIIYLGCFIMVIGFAWPFLSPIKIGQLPGDILFKRPSFTFYFPITTCLLLSLIWMFIAWLLKITK